MKYFKNKKIEKWLTTYLRYVNLHVHTWGMFGEYLVSHPLSKPLYFRKTKKDQYLLFSNGSELLVFDKDTWEGTIINSLPDL